MRIVIIGAGPCGLGAAHRLLEKGHSDFAVYERRPYVGGLAASFLDDRGFTWDFAVHVAHSHYHYIDRLMDDLLPGGFLHHERRSWVREAWFATGKPVYRFVTRRLLKWEDNEGQGPKP